MKTRITLSVIALLLWGWFSRALLVPVTVVAKNAAAVATVNGGDAAFVAQQATNTTVNYSLHLYAAALLVVLILIWAAPVKRLFSQPVTD